MLSAFTLRPDGNDRSGAVLFGGGAPAPREVARLPLDAVKDIRLDVTNDKSGATIAIVVKLKHASKEHKDRGVFMLRAESPRKAAALVESIRGLWSVITHQKEPPPPPPEGCVLA